MNEITSDEVLEAVYHRLVIRQDHLESLPVEGVTHSFRAGQIAMLEEIQRFIDYATEEHLTSLLNDSRSGKEKT